jgi:hypothetical protein
MDIKNPTEKVQFTVIQQDKNIYQYITNPIKFYGNTSYVIEKLINTSYVIEKLINMKKCHAFLLLLLMFEQLDQSSINTLKHSLENRI